jgi:hypothetical protein
MIERDNPTSGSSPMGIVWSATAHTKVKVCSFASLLTVLSLLSSCDRQANPVPTATEIFHLRSECAALGDKIQVREGASTVGDFARSLGFRAGTHYGG